MSTSPHRVVRWNLAAYLERRGRTAHALVQASGLDHNTVDAIVRGEARSVELETLARLTAGLERLTGERVGVADLLEAFEDNPTELAPPEPIPHVGDLGALLAGARPFTFDDLPADPAPDETAEEMVEAVRAWRDEARDAERARG